MTENSTTSQKNVLFIICHDIGNRFGCLGDPYARTPHIDALAEDAVLFNQNYCHWPLCGPSRANIFTGCRPPTTERYNNQAFWPQMREKMGDDYATLPEHFKNHGYFTRGIWQFYHGYETDEHSWSVPQWYPPDPEAPDWLEVMKPSELRHWHTPEARELIRDRMRIMHGRSKSLDDFVRRTRGPGIEVADVPDEAYHDGKATDKALEALWGMSDKQPFFLGVGYEIGHTPWSVPKHYYDLYRREGFMLPPNQEPPQGSPDWAIGDKEPAQYYTMDSYDKPWHPTEEQKLEMMHCYYASISFWDAQIGRILDELDRQGLREQTTIVVMTDHGFHMGEHGYFGKHNLWEMSLTAPVLISDPDWRGQAVRTDALTEHVDVYPTLCDLCGLPKQSYLEGISALPLFEQPGREWKEAVFAHRRCQSQDRVVPYKEGKTLRTNRYRFTRYEDEEGRAVARELFDYQEDPHETVNRAEHANYEEVLAELERRLDVGWREGVPS